MKFGLGRRNFQSRLFLFVFLRSDGKPLVTGENGSANLVDGEREKTWAIN